LKGVVTNTPTTTKTKDGENFYPSSTSPIISTTSSNETNDFIYLQQEINAADVLKNAYFKDFYLNSSTFKNKNNSHNGDDNLILPHVYETIPSIHYCQTVPPSISSSNNSYLIDTYLNYSNTCLLPNTNKTGTIIVLNGQNYYLTPTNDISPTQLSTCSSTSSTRPLTN
jgi:hypothetical protein